MGHRNSPFAGHMIDTQSNQQGRRSHPDPCIIYRNFPQPNNNNNNIHHPSVVPVAAPGNHCNFNFNHTPLPRDGAALFYGVPHRHPDQNIDLAIGVPHGHYNHPYPFPNHGMVGILTDSYGNNTLYVDIKRKNVAGPSSSVSPSESDAAAVALMDGPPQSGSQVVMSTRNNMPGMVANESGRLAQGGFVGPPVLGLLPGNPWSDVHFGANNGDVGAFGGWGAHAPIQYIHGNCLGLDVSASLNGASNRSLSGFHPPPFAQGHPNPHHPLPPHMRGPRGVYGNVNLPSQVAPPRISTITSPNAFVAPVPPMGFRLYQPQQRDTMLDSISRPHTLPHLSVLPEDEVAMLEFPGYAESTDQHRELRLDIDHMSYEELLALGDQIGCVGTGLPEGFIRNNLEIRIFAPSPACLDIEEESFPDEQINFCVICQTDYKGGENIGTVNCGHEYHNECIKKWLLLKNTCPVCKSTALSSKAKGL